MNDDYEKAHAIATRDNRAMMEHEAWWPRQFPWPRLHLKHRTRTITGHPHGSASTAVMVTISAGGYGVRPFRDDNPFEFGPVILYATVDAILADGWIVD